METRRVDEGWLLGRRCGVGAARPRVAAHQTARAALCRGVRGRLSIGCMLLVWALLGLAGFAPLVPTASAHASAVQRYGVDPSQVQAAVNVAGWPQQNRVWCGVAAMTSVIDFHQQSYSQQQVVNYLNTSAAVSEWGTPPPNASIAWGPGVAADISRDVSTDPRSMAQGEAALAGQSFHTVVDRGTALQATYQLAADVASANEPINVIVFHGGHSVLVSAVLATDNPVSDPASITAFEVWDPGFGVPHGNIQQAQMVDVPMSEWLSNAYYWATPYEEGYQGSTAEDPDPAVGPYAYDPSNGQSTHLWVGHYVYIRPDAASDPFTKVSADWAINQNHDLIRGAHDEQPDGYNGPSVGLGDDTIRPGATPVPTTQASASQSSSSGSGGSPTSGGVLNGLCGPGICQSLLRIPLWLFALIPLLLFGLFVTVTIRAEKREQQTRRPYTEWWRTPIEDDMPARPRRRQ